MKGFDVPLVDVLRLKPLPDWRLWLHFSDGLEGIYDLKDFVYAGGAMVEPLADAGYFNRVFVEMGAPTWPNGLDIDPINAYMKLRDTGLLSRPAA
jgi:hypothetical protein